jgi:hypothetical protein
VWEIHEHHFRVHSGLIFCLTLNSPNPSHTYTPASNSDKGLYWWENQSFSKTLQGGISWAKTAPLGGGFFYRYSQCFPW